ncbi:LppU/SCO3897 family protein [Nocardia aurea]|uniref:LppU/SCO3897 family protein n=1 Tax=Nocardia aurea TaxID=2144174 RepID=UPI0033A11A58
MQYPFSRLFACITSAVAASVLTFGAHAAASPLEDLGVGDCVAITDNAPENTVGTSVACSDPNAVYRVHSVHHGLADCPSADYTTYTKETRAGTLRLCLAPNFQQGSCYNDVDTSPYMQVPCGTPEATFRVLFRIDGTTDSDRCPDGSDQYISVPDPATLFCLTTP